jgi:hypothetical protein
MKREEIEIKILDIHKKIEVLEKEIIELKKENILFCDENQWFEEKIESHPKLKYQRKNNFLDGKLVGRVFWKEDFKDEDTGEVITIERQQVVRINGEWR